MTYYHTLSVSRIDRLWCPLGMGPYKVRLISNIWSDHVMMQVSSHVQVQQRKPAPRWKLRDNDLKRFLLVREV